MNYLAHAYLSFNQSDILVGNMISDFVKGSKKNFYPSTIQKGIHLHRAIDSFTDTHSSTKKAKEYFKPSVGLYAGAFVDVVYDHFLAKDKKAFLAEGDLDNFAQATYAALEKFQNAVPEKFKLMLPYMKQQNWLYNYQFKWGIEKSFQGVVRRAKYLQSSQQAFIAFEENYEQLRQCYNSFFEDVKTFALNEIRKL